MFPNLPAAIPNSSTPGGRCAPSVQLVQCNAPDNYLTQCVKAEADMLQRIITNPMFQLGKLPARYWQLQNLPYDEMPPDALRLNAAGGLPFTSVASAGDYYNVPLSLTGSPGYPGFLVPAGYDGIINVTMNKFVPKSGTAFQDGSGYLTWALGINNRLAVNYTGITITQGDVGGLGPVTKGGGIRIKANDLIQWYVSASSAAISGGLDVSGIVVCAIQGWLYPNR
jgi:hypothetical protein